MLTRRTLRTGVMLVITACVSAFFGSLVYQQSLPAGGASLISFYNDSGELDIRATIAEEPEYGGRYTQLLLDELSIRRDGGLTQVHGRILVTTTNSIELHYGDRVLFQGILDTPEAFDGFDYPRYLALSGVYSTAFHPVLSPLDEENRRPIRARLLAANSAMAASLARALPEPESSLAQSLLLGRRAALPEQVEEAFRRTGTAHLLAVSGLHLGIVVAAAIAALLAGMGRRHYLYVWLGLISLWAYALFTGMKPPVVRAALMASTFLAAELAGRQKHGPTALALAAAVMVAMEPQLLWRTSFQLSVLAMGGLIVLFPPLRWALHAVVMKLEAQFNTDFPGVAAATDIIAATTAATIAVWPVSAGTFHEVSMVGVPVSILTLPVLPFALAAASIVAVTALVSAPLAAPFAWGAWLFHTFIIRAVSAFSSLPWASVAMSTGGQADTAVYYAVLSLVPLLWLHWRRPDTERHPLHAHGSHSPYRYALPSLILLLALTWTANLSAPDGRLHVVFLDVGQGDSTLIQTPEGRMILVDGGPDGWRTCTCLDSHRPFWDRSLDMVVITHPHADHLAGLLTVIERNRTSLVLETPAQSDSPLHEQWRTAITATDTAVVTASAGHVVSTSDGAILEILHPPDQLLTGTSDDLDNNGTVLRVTYGEVSFLLAADIRAETEQYLVRRLGSQLRSDVLKVAHHGSSTSSTREFIAAVQPCTAVISVGEDNPYGHPDSDVVGLLEDMQADVLITSQSGTIEFITDGSELWVKTERGRPTTS